MKRDEELNRLIKYAQGMGVTVRFKPYSRKIGAYAEWAMDGSEITIYTRSKCSKIEKILSLIHELSHQKAWVLNNREKDPKMEKILLSEENTKKDRKKILDMEIADSIHWESIYNDTNCQFPIERLRKQREFDLWNYEVCYETGSLPTVKQKSEKMKELRKKYGC